MTTAQEIDPFAGAEKAPSLTFPTVGTTYEGVVTDTPKLVQSRDFESGEPATWPDGNAKMAAVINLDVNGEPRSLWASKPSALFTALAAAQKESGRIEVGSVLKVAYTGDVPNAKNPRLYPQKQYKAKVTPAKPADVFAATTDDSEPPF